MEYIFAGTAGLLGKWIFTYTETRSKHNINNVADWVAERVLYDSQDIVAVENLIKGDRLFNVEFVQMDLYVSVFCGIIANSFYGDRLPFYLPSLISGFCVGILGHFLK